MAYLIYGLLESSLYYGRGSMTFWLLVGLVMAVEALVAGAPVPGAQGGLRLE